MHPVSAPAFRSPGLCPSPLAPHSANSMLGMVLDPGMPSEGTHRLPETMTSKPKVVIQHLPRAWGDPNSEPPRGGKRGQPGLPRSVTGLPRKCDFWKGRQGPAQQRSGQGVSDRGSGWEELWPMRETQSPHPPIQVPDGIGGLNSPPQSHSARPHLLTHPPVQQVLASLLLYSCTLLTFLSRKIHILALTLSRMPSPDAATYPLSPASGPVLALCRCLSSPCGTYLWKSTSGI